jgi:peptide/nickel transport system substrate-binding protein
MRLGTKRLSGLVALAAASLLVAAGCSTSSGGGNGTPAGFSPGYKTCGTDPDNCNSGERNPGGKITVALGKVPAGFMTNNSNENVVETVEQLNPVLPSAFTFLPSGKIQYNKDMLTAEPQVTNQSPQTIVYKINPNAVWNDGTGQKKPINANDFIYAWMTLNGHDKNIPVAGTTGYDSIQSVVGSDNGLTVTVTYKETYADWRGLFSGLYPYFLAASNSGGDATDATKMTDAQLEQSFKAFDALPKYSAGPFIISDYQQGSSLTEIPNPLWYGATKPTLESMTFKYITDDTQDITALQNKEIDGFNVQPSLDLVQQLSNLPGINYEVSAGFAWEHWEFNTANKFLKDVKLRQAIQYAVNVQEMIDKTVKPFFPDAKRLYSHNLFPGEAGYQDIIKTTDPLIGSGNLDEAKKVLTDAGYTGVGTPDGLKTPDGQHVTITFVHTDTTVRDESAQLAQQYMAGLGITMTNKVTADLGGTLGGKNFDIIQFGFAGSPLLSGNKDLWITNGGNNFTNWGDPQSDQLLTQMAQTLDNVQQANLLNQQDQILTKAYADLALYQKPNLQVAASQFVNIRDNNAGSYFTYNTEQWGLLKSAS